MKTSLIVFGLCGAASLFAQGPPLGRGGRMGPAGPGGMMAFGMSAGRTVTGAPYSAEEITESTQTLANGNVITRKTQTNVFRDSSGRVRMEQTLQDGRAIVTIHDPVNGVRTELNASTRIARQVTLPNFRGGERTFPGNRAARTPNGPTSDPNIVRTDLGMQTVNGVQAEGTRVTRTIPAGEIGNAQPIQIVTETWRSPDLQMPVMTRRTDPLHGNVVTQLVNITRAEPDPALFQVPSDYTVTQIRGMRGGANRFVKQ